MIVIRLMNLVLCFFVTCLLFNCTQKAEIKEIEASFLEWELESPIRINCDTFDEYEQFIRTRKLTSSEIKQVSKYLKYLTPKDSISYPDVRIKMNIISMNNKSSTLCIGNDEEMLYNNMPVNYDNNFVLFVKNILY